MNCIRLEADESPAVRLLRQRAATIGHPIGLGQRSAKPPSRSAAAWMACPWPSSWRPRGCACSARWHGGAAATTLALLTAAQRRAGASARCATPGESPICSLLMQCLLRRLGVFVGGWSLEAAEALDLEPAKTVDRLQALLIPQT